MHFTAAVFSLVLAMPAITFPSELTSRQLTWVHCGTTSDGNRLFTIFMQKLKQRINSNALQLPGSCSAQHLGRCLGGADQMFAAGPAQLRVGTISKRTTLHAMEICKQLFGEKEP
ncbi:hypothetical protein B0H14DRAFT_2628715 [Mycena olivaceomarginata]|nr:hypothetical protein B0H14DRAFT_2628715 [Mycena olivaceomarginata]